MHTSGRCDPPVYSATSDSSSALPCPDLGLSILLQCQPFIPLFQGGKSLGRQMRVRDLQLFRPGTVLSGKFPFLTASFIHGAPDETACVEFPGLHPLKNIGRAQLLHHIPNRLTRPHAIFPKPRVGEQVPNGKIGNCQSIRFAAGGSHLIDPGVEFFGLLFSRTVTKPGTRRQTTTCFDGWAGAIGMDTVAVPGTSVFYGEGSRELMCPHGG